MLRRTRRFYVCYAQEDAEFAKSIANDLEEADSEIAIDLLQSGQNDAWSERRMALDAIRRSAGVIVCLSRKALTDGRVRREVKLALDMEKNLCSVLKENCVANLADYDETKKLTTQPIVDPRTDYALAIQEILVALNKGEAGTSGAGREGSQKPRVVVSDFLPRRPTTFVDREEELTHIGDLLKQRQSVLLRGLGGIGKTRLAIELSYRMDGVFPGGVLWLSAVDHLSIDSLLNALAIAFGFDLGGMQISQKKLIVKREIASVDFLLVLDDTPTAEPVLELLDIATNGTLLCTGRPPLYIPGVQLLLLDVLAPKHATELFEAVATRTYSGTDRSVVNKICHLQLEGYPLAIELAANQVRIQNVPLDILLDRMERKTLDSLHVPYLGSIRTPLLSAIEQLTDAERTVFWCLGVFAGRSFTIEAAEYIAFDISNVPDHLFQLVGYSLVYYENGRFGVHPLLKQFAAENISNERPFVRMVEYYVKYAEAARLDNFRGIEEERPNIIGALDWSYQYKRHDLFTSLIDSLLGTDAYYSYWAVNGFWDDATKRLDQAIAASSEAGQEHKSAHYQLALGLFLYWLGKHGAARDAYSSAEAFLSANGDLYSLIRLYWQRGYIEDDEDNYALARQLYQKSLDLALDYGDNALIGTSRELVAVVEYHMGNYERARQLLETGLQESLSASDTAGVTRSQRRLAAVARLQAIRAATPETHKAYIEESRRLLSECLKFEKNRRSRARALRQLGMLDLLEERHDDAREHLESSLALFERLGNRKGIAATLYNLGQLEFALGNADKARIHHQESLEIGREINVKMGVALNLRQLGLIAYEEEHLGEAENLLEQAIVILKTIESPFLEETLLASALVERKDPL